jgi:hypothetical protein
MNRWTILKEAGTNKHGHALVLCRCACGTEKVVSLTTVKCNKSKSCGCLNREMATAFFREMGKRNVGKDSPTWNGGKFIRKGYVMIHSPDHPKVQGRKSPYVQEHVLVMEKKIGRYLLPNETVHHKNGIKDDNRIDNLELWTSNHPAGQRVEDLISYAKNILEIYKDYR